jgi:hypothetical protein
MLLEMNETAHALEEFEVTLTKEPGRFRALYGAAHAAQLSGNRDASQRYFRELLKVSVHADKPGRPEVSEADSQTALKPIIENDRVVVWDVTDSTPARAFDAVVVSLSGSAEFLPKGTPPKIARRSIVIDLKDHNVAPIENASGYPLAFPRPGVKKVLENERVIVWDCSWTSGVVVPMHFHDKDVVALFLDDGDLKLTTLDGKAVSAQGLVSELGHSLCRDASLRTALPFGMACQVLRSRRTPAGRTLLSTTRRPAAGAPTSPERTVGRG